MKCSALACWYYQRPPALLDQPVVLEAELVQLKCLRHFREPRLMAQSA
nr:hypothetical protein [uncultured Rhodococcus sp.]